MEIYFYYIICLIWFVFRGLLESEVGIMDFFLVGRINGLLVVVEVYDRNFFIRVELDWCLREGGEYI